MLSANNAALVERDSELKGLATLLDPAALVTALRADYPDIALDQPRLDYVRYKAGQNCLVSYIMMVNGRPVRVHAKAHRSDEPEKIIKPKTAQGDLPCAGPGYLILPKLKIVVAQFPFDRKLKHLRQIATPDGRRKLLQRILPDKPNYWTGEIEELACKPERRYVFRLNGVDGERAVLKFYTETGYSRARFGAGKLGTSTVPQIPKLLGRSNSHAVLAFEWLPGMTLRQVIGGPDYTPGLVTATAQALAVLHAQSADRLPAIEAAGEYARLTQVAAAVGQLCPDLAGYSEQLTARITKKLVRQHSKANFVHGDFYDQQVIVTDRSAAILDLDQASSGDSTKDLGTFIAHLCRNSLTRELPMARADEVGEEFLEAYGCESARPLADNLNLHIATALLKLTTSPFRRMETNWPQKIAVILEAVDAYIDKAERSPVKILAAVGS